LAATVAPAGMIMPEADSGLDTDSDLAEPAPAAAPCTASPVLEADAVF